jgi:hypothetical protein
MGMKTPFSPMGNNSYLDGLPYVVSHRESRGIMPVFSVPWASSGYPHPQSFTLCYRNNGYIADGFFRTHGSSEFSEPNSIDIIPWQNGGILYDRSYRYGNTSRLPIGISSEAGTYGRAYLVTAGNFYATVISDSGLSSSGSSSSKTNPSSPVAISIMGGGRDNMSGQDILDRVFYFSDVYDSNGNAIVKLRPILVSGEACLRDILSGTVYHGTLFNGGTMTYGIDKTIPRNLYPSD